MSRSLAYLAHLYTGLGVLIALLVAANISAGDYRKALLWMLVALAVDSTDGFLARFLNVKGVAPEIDGRRLDDIVDYLNYTFLPLLMIGMAGWLPDPWPIWVFLAAMASLFGFCNRSAKAEEAGFFLGFPSYWNIVALYFFLLFQNQSGSLRLSIILALAVATLIPIRFIYPSHSKRWRVSLMGGGLLWGVLVLSILWTYPATSGWVIAVSALYPGFYIFLSLVEG